MTWVAEKDAPGRMAPVNDLDFFIEFLATEGWLSDHLVLLDPDAGLTLEECVRSRLVNRFGPGSLAMMGPRHYRYQPNELRPGRDYLMRDGGVPVWRLNGEMPR